MPRKLKFKLNFRIRKRKRHKPRCSDCKEPLSLSRGWGHCENCMHGEALPIGWIASRGPHEGKEVYLESSLLREASQEGVFEDALDDVEEELRERDYFVIREADYE